MLNALLLVASIIRYDRLLTFKKHVDRVARNLVKHSQVSLSRMQTVCNARSGGE
jgi:hypothetical protein